MSQNLASKFSSKVDEAFKKASITDVAVNQDYDWDGVNSINVYGVGTSPMNTYSRTGSNRYGTPNELDDTKTNYALTRDRAFTFTIDRRNREESLNVTEAGAALRRQIDLVVTPEIDVYRLAALNAAITANSAFLDTGVPTSSTAYGIFLDVNARISNLLVPMTDRKAFMTAAFYNFLKLSGFVVASEIAMGDRKTGNLGNVDGVEPIIVPSAYMPGNTDLIITHPIAMTSPMVLADYVIHENAPGINGHLVEGRVVYDAFALTNKVNAIAGHKTS
jgi:hypothetical protein